MTNAELPRPQSGRPSSRTHHVPANQLCRLPVAVEYSFAVEYLSNIKDERRRNDTATVTLRVCIPRDDSELIVAVHLQTTPLTEKLVGTPFVPL